MKPLFSPPDSRSSGPGRSKADRHGTQRPLPAWPRGPARAVQPALFLALALTALPLGAEILERVVAKVGAEILTLSEFEARQVAAVQAARVPAAEVERFLRDNNQRILQEAVDDLLLLQRARELGLRVRPEYLDELLDSIKKDNGITTEEQLQEQLSREGLSLGEFKRSVERSVLRRQVVARDLEAKITVTDAEALAEFQAHRDQYATPASVQLAEIVLEGPEAVSRALGLAERARGGADFAALAREHSSSPSAREGGDLGRVVRGELAPELEQAAFALPVGGVSAPIPTANGVRLLKVVAKQDAAPPTFDTARPVIVQRLTQERMAQRYETYIEGLRKTAGAVDLRVREVPLQVTVPAAGGLTGATPPTAPAPKPSAGSESGDEFETTPQAKPERVVPEPTPRERPETPPSPPPQS